MKKVLIILLAINFVELHSQDNNLEELHKILSKDLSNITLLFSYPDTLRNAILITSTYPQGIVKLEEIQKKSSSSFKNIVSKYNISKQKQFWEITRYPELIPILIKNKDKNKDALKDILVNYPENARKSAIDLTLKNYAALIEIDSIHKEFEINYKNTVKSFPEDVKKSFNILIQKPELIGLMSEDIKTIILLGNLYKSEPTAVIHAADSINKKITQEGKNEYEDWKNGINNDPKVQKELKKVTSKYEKDEDYVDDIYNNKKTDITIINIIPYPYWAGYPHWYHQPYWYPYPWWYHSGFYWSNDGTIIFNGMPSYYFGWWYFNHPNYHYPKTTNYIHQHYQIHPRSTQGFNRSRRETYSTPSRKR